ncbi:outer membrane beta-barrel protein [Thalassolituus sp. C2-1]|uniref:outer membrane beta-barrel protein n=1 Tax=Venatorbacter sp. C2-1 TaxID=2597518 RepID=UPI0011932902|nr:outer membrane beta-barrel protein [Thalassolituus sp. C2-1]TVV44764.1 porin family protein [Thalassolituus sp. C2-1]
MQLMATLRTSVNIAVATALLGMSSLASAERIEETPSAGAMVADAVLARPLYFVLSQAGALIYGATLPFTLLGGNADQAAETLVVTPLQAAFVRCLGCGKVENEVGSLNEGDGKRIRHFVMLSGGAAQLDTDGETGNGATYGLYLGTHFELTDKSRFDVMLGAKRLAETEIKASTGTFKDSATSYQIVSRFGREVFGNVDLMFKLGAHHWSAERKLNTGSKGDTSGNDFLWGVGLDTGLGDKLRVGLDYTSYSMENKDDGYDAGIDTLDLNVSYLF